MKKITVMNGNRANGIKGQRISIWDGTELVDRFVVPKYEGVKYCREHPNGYYGKRFRDAMNK